MNMLIYFILLFAVIILAELLKGLSANGTPPVLQRFSWQLDLAHFMWSHIGKMRATAAIFLIVLAVLIPAEHRLAALGFTLVLAAIWGGIYWLFNRFWVGKYKFPPIKQKHYLGSADSKIPADMQVIGIDYAGQQLAVPVCMVFYHHQIPDLIADHPIWITYCGLCRSGRVYDLDVAGKTLDFSLVGAISYNAVFEDNQTQSWWRQETGQAVKGPMTGSQLKDIPFQQLSLNNWLQEFPDTKILQFDPQFAKIYGFVNGLLTYEDSLPGWHNQETPPMVTGIEIDGQARAYDWNELEKRKLIQDELSDVPLLILAEPDGLSGLVYNRRTADQTLEFELDAEGRLSDITTGSTWSFGGKCLSGPLKGEQLARQQSYQQYVRAWLTFHKNTSFFEFR